MSPARSRRSASHAAGTHDWLPKKTGRPGLRRGGVVGYNLHSVPPDCGTPTTSRLYPFGAHGPLQPPVQPLSHDLSDSGDMEVFIDHPNTETWQGHLSRNFVSAYLASLSNRKSTGVSDSAHYQQISQPDPDQHGFRPDHSTTSALLQITTYIAMGFNQRKPPD